MPELGLRAVLVAVLLVASVAAVTPTTTATQFADGEQRSYMPHERENFSNNWTITWKDGEGDTGDPDNDPWGTQGGQYAYYPGQRDVQFYSFSRRFPIDYLPIGNLTVAAPAAQNSTCETTQARAFGVDRDNDQPGTETEPQNSLIPSYTAEIPQVRDDGKNVTTYSFYSEGEPGFGNDNSFDLYKEDEIVASLADCYDQPDVPGWYRWVGGINGSNDGDPDDTTWQPEQWYGNDPGEYAVTYSHWYWICQCENRQDAIEKMGPPPTQNQDAPGWWWFDRTPMTTDVALVAYDVDGDGIPDPVYNDKTTDPADYWSSQANEEGNDYWEAGNWQERQSRAEGSSQPTPTAEGTDTPTPTDGGATTPTPTEDGAATTPTPTDGGATTPTPTDGGMTTPTDDGGPATPTQQNNQPGFGIIVAVVALIGAALIGLRRR